MHFNKCPTRLQAANHCFVKCRHFARFERRVNSTEITNCYKP